MSITYASPRDILRASKFNELYGELDDVMRALFQGKSPLAYNLYADIEDNDILGQLFYFGDSGSWKIIPSIDPLATEYDQSAFDAIAAALTIDNYITDPCRLARSSAPSWDLDGSLHVHHVYSVGQKYFLAQWDGVGNTPILTRERFRKTHVAEIIMEEMDSLLVNGEWVWDSRFDKFHFLRFHNLQPVELTVNLGSLSITIPPFGIQAVRRTYPAADEWDAKFTYLWAARSGDEACWLANAQNNVYSLENIHRWLDWMSLDLAGRTLSDPRVMWEPTMHPLPAIDTSKRIAEYKWPVGRIISWEDADGPRVNVHDNTPTWAQLEAGTGLLKITHPAPGTIRFGYDTGATTPVDSMGVGTSLLPVWPTTLPWDLPGLSVSASVKGVYRSNTSPNSLTASYYDPLDPPPGGTPIQVDSDEWYSVGETSWTWANTDAWQTLAERDVWSNIFEGHPTTPEQMSAPVGEWKTDGWRLMYVGIRDFVATNEYSPVSVSTTNWWEISDTAISLTYGFDATDRSGWFHTSGRHGRKAMDYDGYTDLFDVVYHEGNPDVTGTYGIEDGIDWEQDRQPEPTATIKRTEEIQQTTVQTLTLPVQKKEDAAERIVSRYDDVDWYLANRSALLIGTTEKWDRQQVVKYPILAAHFNHAAQRINAIRGVSPYTIADLLYYGEFDDGSWPGTWNAYPQRWYCAVLSAGSRADELLVPVSSVTENATTAYYITLDDVALKASQWGLAMTRQDLVTYRTQLETPGGGFVSNARTDVGTYQLPTDAPYVTRHTEDANGHYLDPPGSGYSWSGVNAHVIGCEESIDVPEIPTGWALENGSRLLCIPRPGIGYDNDPLTEPDATEYFEPLSAFSAPTGDPKFLPIDQAAAGAIPLPATHADITTAAGSTGDDRSIWECRLVRRVLIVRT